MAPPDASRSVEDLAQALYEASDPVGIRWAKRSRIVREPWLEVARCTLSHRLIRPRAEGVRAVFLRLTIQEAGDGFRATLSQRDDESKAAMRDPETFVVKTKDQAKRRARAMARELGLATFRVIDKNPVGRVADELRPGR